MVTLRSDGSVTYHEYEDGDVRSMRPEMDGVEVGAAFIAQASDTPGPTVGIVIVLTAQQQESGTSLEGAIAAARNLLPRLVDKHRSEVASITENRNYVCTWDGALVKRRG